MSARERSTAPAETEDRAAHHRVDALRVTGGFLAGEQFEFVDGLNCLIGGRGAGKTTALELLRYGLGLMPDPRLAQPRYRSIEALVKANLGNGRIAVALRTKMGMTYTAERGAGEPVQVLNEAGIVVPISLDRDLIFGADVFSQNEVEEIAANPSAQLVLLDRFVQEEAAAIERDLTELRRQLQQTSAELIQLDTEIEDLRAQASELAVVREKLKGYEQVAGPDSARLTQAHAKKTQRQRESTIADQVLRAASTAVTSASASARAFESTLIAQFDDSLTGSANREVLATLEADARVFLGVLDDVVAKVVDSARVLEQRASASRAILDRQHSEQDAAYRHMLSEFEQEGGRIAERAALQEHLARALAAAKAQEAKETQRKRVVSKRASLLSQASELRDRLFAARRSVAERLTQTFDGGIRVTVDQAANVDAYRSTLTDALRGAGLKQGPTAERLVEHLLPTELARAVLAGAVETILQVGFDEDRARRIVDALKAHGRAYEIELLEMDDLPRIELRDGDVYKDSTELSTGQRCTAILPILLLQSERPLLVDQPEDNLDNAFIYETVVKSLRSAKGRRQIIFVTHNPNIPVLGEAERIFVLESNGRKASIRQVGTVDECKDSVETILEGGSEAFLKRKARYGY